MKPHQRTSKWALGVAALLLLTAPSVVNATLVSGGTSSVAVAAVAVEVDPATLSLNTAMAKGGCKGLPVADMACAATAVGKVEVCARVSGTAGGFIPVEGEACTSGGGAAFAMATMSMTVEVREANALAQGFRSPHTEDDGPPKCQGRDEYVYPNGEPYKTSTRTCYQPKKTVQDVEERKESCVDTNNWVQQTFWDFMANPTTPNAWMPGWNLQTCAEAAFVMGADFDCIYAEAEAKASSDLHKEESDSALPSCSGQPAWDSANQNKDDAQSTEASASVTAPEGNEDGADIDGGVLDPVTGLVLPTLVGDAVEKTYVLASQLVPEDQEELKSLLKRAYLSRMKEVIDAAAASTLPGEPDQGIVRVRLFEALLPALETKVDEVLAEDFLVEFKAD